MIGNLTIQHGNGGTGGAGGGIANAGTLTVTNCTVSGNTAHQGGGVSNGGTVTVTNSTFSGNSASGYGGGILNLFGTLTVTNSTFAGNSTESAGGGISNNEGRLAVTNSTFSANSATDGGGIFATGPATLTNTVVASSTSGGDLDGTFGGNNNLIDDAASAPGFADGTGGNIVGHPALLGSLGSYGGSTQTIPLLPGSPAIDAGAAVGSGPAGATVPAADQRGKSRMGAPDIGAFESQGFTLAVTGGDNQSAVVNDAFAQPLALTVAAVNPVEPVAGGMVTFTPPTTGPSATLTGSPATVGAGGQASVTATANGVKGAYTVGASAGGTTSATFHLTNTAPLVSIAVTPATVTLKVGQAQQFTATGTYADSSTADITSQVTWTSDAPGVVGVDAGGKGTAKSASGAHITAAQGGVSGQAGVTVGTPVLTGVQPAPAPANRPSGASTTPAGSPAPAPIPAPKGRPAG
jgi:predicted outer membrane repeat protein